MELEKKLLAGVLAGLFSLGSAMLSQESDRNRGSINVSTKEEQEKSRKTIYDIPFLSVEMKKTNIRKEIIDKENVAWREENKSEDLRLLGYTTAFGPPFSSRALDGKVLYEYLLYRFYYKKDFKKIDSKEGQDLSDKKRLIDYSSGQPVFVKGSAEIISEDIYHSVIKSPGYFESVEEYKEFKIKREEFFNNVIYEKDSVIVLLNQKDLTKTFFQCKLGIVDKDISRGGKRLYLGLSDIVEYPPPKEFEGKGKKIQNSASLSPYYLLSDIGGVYLIDLEDNMNLLFYKLGPPTYSGRFSEDESVFFTGKSFINIRKGEERKVRGSAVQREAGAFIMSSNGLYVAWNVGVDGMQLFPESKEGYGIDVYTQNGTFHIGLDNIWERKFYAGEISNDGRIIDKQGYIFEYDQNANMYRCVKTPNNNFELLKNIRIVKID